MDRLIYVAMTGAKHTLGQQATVAHNLANASTTGFRAQLSVFQAVPLAGEGAATRVYVMDSTPRADFTPGPIQHTGRDLDVAVEGKGWIAVQATDGSEAYTRAGNLRINENGLLQTANGYNVVGDGGTIAIPADNTVAIGRDGTVSTIPAGNRPNQIATAGRIKLVNPDENGLVRGPDGLFRAGGGAVEADAAVKVVDGALEGSNVNAVEAMIGMIVLARQFDMQMKMLNNADSNDRQANQLLAVNR